MQRPLSGKERRLPVCQRIRHGGDAAGKVDLRGKRGKLAGLRRSRVGDRAAMGQPQRQHLSARAFEPPRQPLQQRPRAVEPAQMHRRAIIPEIAYHDGALLPDDRQRPVTRCGKTAGQARGHAGTEGQAADGKIRRHGNIPCARPLVGECQRREGLSLFNSPEQRHQPGQAVTGMLERAADLEFVQARPSRARVRAPLRPVVLEHRPVFHFGIGKPRRADPPGCDQAGDQLLRIGKTVGRRTADGQSLAVGQIDDGACFLEGHAERLLAIDVLARIQRRAIELEMAFRRRQVDEDFGLAVAQAFLERSVGPDIVKPAELRKPVGIAIPCSRDYEPGVVGKRGHVVVGNKTGAGNCDLGHGPGSRPAVPVRLAVRC